MSALMPTPKQQYFGIASIPLIGGKIFTYAAGSSTLKATFTDAAGTVPQANPITLNARGEPANAIFWNGSYRVVVQDALGNIIYSVDNFQTPLMPGDLSGAGAAGTIGFDYTVTYAEGSIGRWLADLARSTGGSFIGFSQEGTGAITRTITDKLHEMPTYDDYGADGTGAVDSAPAFARAHAEHKAVKGAPGSIYLLETTVTLADADMISIGNGGKLLGKGATMIKVTGSNCTVDEWDVDASNALYAFHNEAAVGSAFRRNKFKGNVGHYIFDRDGINTDVSQNRVDGREIDLITTSFVFERTKHFSASGNHFKNAEHWCIQTRGASHGAVNANVCFGTEYLGTVVAAAGQTAFDFVLSAPCHLAGIQVDGLPVDTGITFLPAVPATTPTKNWRVTFAAAPGAGKAVKIIAFRSAENIQINNASTDIAVTGNSCTGSGDSGIIIAGGSMYCTVTGNTVQNISYSGISIEGGSEGNVVTGNTTRDCAKVTNAATYSSGILVGGNNNFVGGNAIINTAVPNPQKYGVSVNTYGLSNGGIDAQLKIGQNVYFSTSQPYLRDIFIPNEDAAQRRQSISIFDGVRSSYPAQIDLDSAWANNPTSTPYFAYAGFGGTFAIRDAAVKLGGVASLKTVANEYVDITLLASSILLNTIVEITFWAKNDSGSSYMQTFLDVGGVFFNSPLATITSTSWKQYRLSFPVTPNINTANIKIRVGANSGFANFQHIQIAMTAIP